MNVWGRAIATFDPPTAPSAIRDSAALMPNSALARFASRFATWKPTLWRVVANPSPGFPRPTTSRSTFGGAERSKSLANRTSASLLLYVNAEKGRHRLDRGRPADAYRLKNRTRGPDLAGPLFQALSALLTG